MNPVAHLRRAAALTTLAVAVAACSAQPGDELNRAAVERPPTPSAEQLRPLPSISAPPPTQRTRIGATVKGTVPPVVYHGPRNGKRIALTFDSNMTETMLRKITTKGADYANEAVIDQLQRLKVPATFFLAGKWIRAYPQLTRRIAADPTFELASHSWSHDGFRPKCYGLGDLAPSAMSADVDTSFAVLDEYTDRATRYFRFPGGCYDQTALRSIAASGCTVVQYDVASGDAFGTSARAIVETTVSRSRGGSIVVLHITEANSPFTDEALPVIVAALRAKGYELVTLTDLLHG